MALHVLFIFGVGALAVLVIFWNALAQLDAHPVVETVWPTSVAGWIGIGISATTFVAIIWHAIKKPGEVAAKAVEERLVVRLDKITDTVAILRADSERGVAEFKDGLDQERRECADRLDEIRKDFRDYDQQIHAMDKNWTQSREDRRHLGQVVTEVKESIARWREEDRARDDRMLEAMVRLKGGRND